MENNLLKIKVNFWLLSVLAAIVLLRIPSFFEPYYDGDESVYYTLGQMMDRGAVLYRDIWDNKPPLLYFLYAIHPTLFWAKLSATLAVLATAVGTYFLCRKIFARSTKPVVLSLLSTALVGIFLSIPVLEGNTANAELYFALPIVWGAYVVFSGLQNSIFRLRNSIVVGALATVAFLLKVPAIFDFVGILLAFSVVRFWQQYKDFKNYLLYQVRFYAPVVVVFGLSMSLVLLYFFLNHALPDFITAVFSQNSTYVSFWSGPLGRLANPLFLRGLVLIFLLLVSSFLLIKKRISMELLFLVFWLGFSLTAAMLSGRPYPHYLLQIVVPFTILFFYALSEIKRYWLVLVIYALLLFGALKMFGPLAQFVVGKWYYDNFFDYISERKSWEDYTNYFYASDSYQMAQFLGENTKPSMPTFVWGENAYIYFLSNRPPVTKFIRAHHLTTVDGNNYDKIIERLQTFQPKYIFVARPVQFPFPALEIFLSKNYRESRTFGNFHVYQNVAPVTPPPWKPAYN